MSLKYALLGLLAHTPRHGYELKAAFETSFSQMRLLNTGQIYTTLARLSADGLVNSRTVEQSQAPARKVYELTQTGKQVLEEWLALPVENHFDQVKSEFFTKLLVTALIAGPAATPAQLAMIERQRARLQSSLAELRRSRLQLTMVLGPRTADPRPALEQESSEIKLLLLEGAILHLEADLTWLGLVEARLERLAGLHQKPESE